MILNDYQTWKEMIAAGEKPIARLIHNGSMHQLSKTITGELELCRINLKTIGENFGLNLHDCLAPLFDQWLRAGLMEREKDWVMLTTAGQFWQVNISQLSLDYLHKTLHQENATKTIRKE